MSENRKKLISIVIMIVIAYIAFKILKLLFYAIVVGTVLYIGYKVVSGASEEQNKLE